MDILANDNIPVFGLCVVERLVTLKRDIRHMIGFALAGKGIIHETQSRSPFWVQ